MAHPDRTKQAEAFLVGAGWGLARRAFLAGDASDRRYERLWLGEKTAVLMDAPPGKGDDPAQFLAVADHLQRIGLSAPHCLAKDLTSGFLLLEDFGDGVFARLIETGAASEQALYAEAGKALTQLQSEPPMAGLQNLSSHDWAEAACFALDWYRAALTDAPCDRSGFAERLTEVISRHADGPRVMILRDFHAENLIWLPDRQGVQRVGLLDFQLAQLGQPGYDLVSLLQDARRDVSRETQLSTIGQFKDAIGADASFDAAYAVLGAQRALRILGIFARLCLVAAKPGYLDLMPRVWGHLQENLAHPANAPLADVCASVLPEPTRERLQRIREKCPSP